jgi:phage shock protein C
MHDRLYRSRSDRMLLGVAGGMARYLDIDPAVVRIVWALLVIAGGAGLLLYVVAAIVIPEEPAGWVSSRNAPDSDATGSPAAGAPTAASGSRPAEPSRSGAPWAYRAGVDRRDRGAGAVLIGVILIALGAWFLVRRFYPQLDLDVIWPVVLLVLGGALILGAMRRR